jgi:hypothetical protein
VHMRFLGCAMATTRRRSRAGWPCREAPDCRA